MEPPKILVVDDQPINVKLLKRKLERQQMTVVSAYSGQECLDMVKKDPPDLILLDVMMPGVDGIQVCQEIKNNPGIQGIPVLFISAKSTKEGKIEGLESGAVDYITKPIDTDEVVARIRAHLRHLQLVRQSVLFQEKEQAAGKPSAAAKS